MNTIERFQATAVGFGGHPLLVSPDGQVISLADGYIPLLANFTFEDKEAKGLRKGNNGVDEEPKPPVYFSALELVRDTKILLLCGTSGAGKTSFAKHLAFQLATTPTGSSSIGPRPLVRNEIGTIHDEQWEEAGDVVPCYFNFAIRGPESLTTLIDDTLLRLMASTRAEEGHTTKRTFLIILDSIDRAGEADRVHIAKILAFVRTVENIRLLLLGDRETSTIKHWALPPDVVRHDFLPLLKVQRQQLVSSLATRDAPPNVAAVGIGAGSAAATPAYFALALQAQHRGGQAEELLDAWLAIVAPGKSAADGIAAQAFDDLVLDLGSKSLDRHDMQPSVYLTNNLPLLFSSTAVLRLLAALHLLNLPIETAVALFQREPSGSEPVVRSLLARLHTSSKSIDLIEGLVRGSGTNAQLGALLASDFIAQPSASRFQEQISSQMLAVIEQGTLPAGQREQAARVLSRLGDPRDLTALGHIPAGVVTLGSDSHPNSQPTGRISMASFRIGLYPVVNRDFSLFVRETGRAWQSPDGFSPEKQAAPATDLTWYDAVAYCKWLTRRWRLNGRIGPDEHVRLPTEPEWERASRGDQDIGEMVYPWGMDWQDDAANCEESGFNTTCSVGLFPKGRSPYGCYDMAGQVWEWCSTLWGQDMATPSFRYPWCDDGREALDAPGSVRRVLRGGCFSSGRFKISCTYRGSLEPGAFWRGNGFRIVVADQS